jgi:hypothetical protein
MHNGGEGFKYGVRLIFHLGGKSTSSAKKLTAVNVVVGHINLVLLQILRLLKIT